MAIEPKITARDLVAAAEREVETLTPEEANRRRVAGEAVIVDVRDVRELARVGRIPGSLHLPRGMLEFWIDPSGPYFKPVFSEPIGFVFHCALGWRSALAAKTAQDMGLERVAHIGGGFEAWKAAGLPVEKESDQGPATK